ncbi:hypothetical protein E1284_04870, partial [Actinomadura bangladeshensis]
MPWNPFRRPARPTPAPASEAAPSRPAWTTLPPPPLTSLRPISDAAFGPTLPTWQNPVLTREPTRLLRPAPPSSLAGGLGTVHRTPAHQSVDVPMR